MPDRPNAACLVALVALAASSACSRRQPALADVPLPRVATPAEAGPAGERPDASPEAVVDVAPEAEEAEAGPEPLVWTDLGTIGEPERTEDGIPVINLAAEGAGREGNVAWISDAWRTLEFAQYQASDGVATFVAVSRRGGTYSDVVVRGGQVQSNVLPRLAGLETHGGGCGAAADGLLLLSSPLGDDRANRQGVWVIRPDGGVEEHVLGVRTPAEGDCVAWVDPDGAFTVGTFRLAHWDGNAFVEEEPGLGWLPARTSMATARGPRYCFEYCNATETAGSDPAAETLRGALGCSAEYAVYGEWLAGWCPLDGKAARLRRGGEPEVRTGIPTPREALAGKFVLTTAGDVVLGLDYGLSRYVVWRTSGELGPRRALAEGELLAAATPTILLRGLPPPVPDATAYAVVLGRRLPFGASGSTYGFSGLHRGPEARAAQVARARAVMPAETLWVVHDTVVDPACGAYVRSPLGWEGERIMDWEPPDLPPLHEEAVYRPETCTPLASVAALPGDTDLLLAKTADGRLAAAWLPPPLPLPSGRSQMDDDESEPREPPAQQPRPGSGWTLFDPIAAIEGDDGVPEPGEDTAIRDGTWQAGGGALLRTEDATILLTPGDARAIPADTAPMSVRLYATGAYGALGSRLLVCDPACRVLDPGPTSRIVAVVPRTETALVLGYEDGRIGLYEVPPQGGEAVPDHPLAQRLRRHLRTRPQGGE